MSVEKEILGPGTYLYPNPVVVVSVGTLESANLLTIAWAGTVSSEPPCVSIAVKKTRYSFKIIKETKEFVINVPNTDHLRIVDYCGVVSGSKVDKVSTTGLTLAKSEKIHAPYIEEFPVNIECRVNKEVDVGSHVLFIAEALVTHIAKGCYNNKTKKPDPIKLNPLYYNNGFYMSGKIKLGAYGFTQGKF
ncbi:MAG TPA: flavin reductase family protein [Candidatus Lokiarchaeia archaeon]|nr:flavin reductase family protein [Candidatus Lokiarchaeia archaeon]